MERNNETSVCWWIVVYQASHANALRAHHAFPCQECLLNGPVTSVRGLFKKNSSLYHLFILHAISPSVEAKCTLGASN